MIKVTVWNEYCHEQESAEIAKIYPKGIHSAIAEFLGTNEELPGVCLLFVSSLLFLGVIGFSFE